jgi:hypothetical protein
VIGRNGNFLGRTENRHRQATHQTHQILTTILEHFHINKSFIFPQFKGIEPGD